MEAPVHFSLLHLLEQDQRQFFASYLFFPGNILLLFHLGIVWTEMLSGDPGYFHLALEREPSSFKIPCMTNRHPWGRQGF